MPIHIVSKDTKLHIPALFQVGFTVKDICGLLGVKKILVYKKHSTSTKKLVSFTTLTCIPELLGAVASSAQWMSHSFGM
ncbi:hypothetical protein OG21DRAFT_1515597 [Imleria badia]|nr:hypothetical protein OG21DRAFT_1515597 [Imleria badia]